MREEKKEKMGKAKRGGVSMGKKPGFSAGVGKGHKKFGREMSPAHMAK